MLQEVLLSLLQAKQVADKLQCRKEQGHQVLEQGHQVQEQGKQVKVVAKEQGGVDWVGSYLETSETMLSCDMLLDTNWMTFVCNIQ